MRTGYTALGRVDYLLDLNSRTAGSDKSKRKVLEFKKIVCVLNACILVSPAECTLHCVLPSIGYGKDDYG
jgi:hypothetical protein